MHESEKWKWSRSVMSDSWRPYGLQPTRLLHPWDFPGKRTGVGCHCLLQGSHLKVWFDVLPSLVWQMLQHFVSVDSFHKYILSNLTHSFELSFNNFQAICGLTFSFSCHWYRNIHTHTTELSQLSDIFSWITNFKNMLKHNLVFYIVHSTKK